MELFTNRKCTTIQKKNKFQIKVHNLIKSYFKNPNFMDARNSNSIEITIS